MVARRICDGWEDSKTHHGYDETATKDPEMYDKMHCKMSSVEVEIIKGLAKTAIQPYEEIEYVYRCVESFDLTIMCISLSCQLNLSLMDMARHVERAVA
ncbi:hypothetical protein LCGC14_2245350 [marine sediment metagenome]|uniref:Uncharacterized protein n=1 Tax=marine sediment metagenome TaxID=412755 RepID=A0A0F9FZ96_9ZZZZ